MRKYLVFLEAPQSYTMVWIQKSVNVYITNWHHHCTLHVLFCVVITKDNVRKCSGKMAVLSKCYDFYPTFIKALDSKGVNMQTQAEKDAVFYLRDCALKVLCRFFFLVTLDKELFCASLIPGPLSSRWMWSGLLKCSSTQASAVV